jgi:ABC-type bacteriocin/lantibiotic exporter with double-glycine peptidase domain
MVGKGKSTLLKMILKLTYPSNGEILLDDMNLPYDVIRKNISYIPQTPILFNRKLYKNIVYGTKSTKEDVIHLMKKYNLNGVFGKHDLEDDVGKGGGNLSGGQKQVVIILRSILRNSSIILLDEPTSSLDKKLKNIIMELIFDVFKDKTVLIITHDEDILPLFKDINYINSYETFPIYKRN